MFSVRSGREGVFIGEFVLIGRRAYRGGFFTGDPLLYLVGEFVLVNLSFSFYHCYS
jgi:hypothetical protein